MKIINENNCYVERKDIEFIFKNCSYPKTIYDELANEAGLILWYNHKEKFIEFTNIESVEYLKNADFILDCSEVSKFSVNELAGTISEKSKKLDTISQKYASFSDEQKQELNKDKKYTYAMELLKYQLINLKEFNSNRRIYQEKIKKKKKVYVKK